MSTIMRSTLVFALLVLLLSFVAEQGITHNYQDFGYLYVNVHASAGANGSGEDANGNYTDYWAYGSTSLSTPSSIEGDNII